MPKLQDARSFQQSLDASGSWLQFQLHLLWVDDVCVQVAEQPGRGGEKPPHSLRLLQSRVVELESHAAAMHLRVLEMN